MLTMKTINKNWHRYVPFMVSDLILARWWPPVASSKALGLLHQATSTVMYQRISMSIKMARKVGVCFCCCFVCFCPGGYWGNMEQVVTQWQHQGASCIALDMLHQAMCFVLHWRTTMAIKTAGGWGTFAHCHLRFPRSMLWDLLLCLQLVCILWAATDSNRCRFSHHCCQQTSPNSIKHRGQ